MFPDVSGCPHLAELRLNDNSITTVPKTVVASCEHKALCCLSVPVRKHVLLCLGAVALRVLDLGNNPIMEWKNVRELRHLPRLVNLSLK